MWLTIKNGEQANMTVEVGPDRFVIGRDSKSDLVILDPRVSRQHAYIETQGDGTLVLQDLASRNGTFVNRKRVHGPTRLTGNEQLHFGETAVATSREEPVGATSAERARLAAEEAEAARTSTMAGEAEASGTSTRVAGTPTRPETPQPTIPLPPATPTAPLPPLPPAAPFPPAGEQPIHAGVRTPGPATLERRILRRSVRRATVLATISTLVAVTVVALFATGVLPPEPEPTPSPSPSPTPASVADIIREATPGTVLITTLTSGQEISGGTGWVLDAEEGLIVTNFHVVNGGDSVAVGVGTDSRGATVVGGAPCEDIALLRVSDTEGLKAMELGSQEELSQGDSVVALGFPVSASNAENLTATVGVVSVVKTRWTLEALDVPAYPNVVQTDAAINPGNSGGPLVNLRGELVGMNSAGIDLLGGRTIENQGYAVGVDRLKEILPTLQDGKSVLWTGMGLEYPTTESELTSLGLPPLNGLIIAGAYPETPAAQAGLGTSPSLLLEVNGVGVDNTLMSYCTATAGAESGQTATLTLVRSGENQARTVGVAFL